MSTNILYLFEEEKEENPDYLNKQLITYIGNKRSLLPFIGRGIDFVLKRLNKRRLSTFDVFSGSGIVARYLKRYSNKIIVNDLEKYSETINKCYLTNVSELNLKKLKECYYEIIFKLENEPLKEGFISELYAPKCDNEIRPGERVFYTRRNAMYIDTSRQYIENIPEEYRHYFIAPLLSEASIHANTSGVFKGFYKDSEKKVGKYGGRKEDALLRILGDIHLHFPVFSDFECEVEIHRGDSNVIVNCVDEVDIAYLDPPYNQHPYGSNYFMLNLITEYIKPAKLSKVSGIPANWNRSAFNKKNLANKVFEELVNKIKAKFLIISFNSEGFITQNEMMNMLNKVGIVTVLETKYNTFRGSRNLRNRNIHVKEYLYLVEKK
ncbi:MAG: DNA modification methylase [Spirochaetes bacterium]|nr:MAG: DNA modification methylase [Spirochaetota bacterium]